MGLRRLHIYECFEQSCINVEKPSTALAALAKSSLLDSPTLNEKFKLLFKINSSAHNIKIVRLPYECDLVESTLPIEQVDLNKLPGPSKFCYLKTKDNKFYYLDKKLKRWDLVICRFTFMMKINS